MSGPGGGRWTAADARERFDHWSSTYEQSLFWKHYFVPLHEMMVARAGDVGGLSVLDLGCGTGDLLRRFARAGASRLVGADVSEGMLEVARGLSRDLDYIEYVHTSAESVPVGAGEFDLVTTCIAFHHFPDPAGALKDAVRALKPGGRLMLCDLDGAGLPGRIFLAFGRWKRADERYFDTGSISRMLAEAGFADVSAERVRLFPPTMLAEAIVQKGQTLLHNAD
ncbi:MAG: methyltransferase domain-containing protein [Actinobacteria bacterium]|nr:methyltransferase domain-containing protein [Actinomycetota bacterium]MBU1943788.1 methyltransferase domain-containing protein [Actinomycetota bacterium]MBU2689051.1 methyltransferase domain-containing protein [Actinomycetota bacterium]